VPHNRRAFLRSLIAAGLAPRFTPAFAESGERLYNGIRLATPWPPRNRFASDWLVRPPYLDDPPAIIPIDLGRQLFVDDFLIQATTLTRRFHRATYAPENPILRPLTAWERFDPVADRTGRRSNPTAMVFSDGVFYDPAARLFKMWYMGGYGASTCYVFSEDGVNWIRPRLDVVRDTNIVLKQTRDSSTVWLDQSDPDPANRYKMSLYDGSERLLQLLTSPDGIHWSHRTRSGPTGDRTTFFNNPFRKRWVFSLRDDVQARRGRRYWECEDFLAAARWAAGEPPLWVTADPDDPQRPDYGVPAQLYNLDCVGYESVLLGLFTIWRGEQSDREKPNEVCVGFSRDGFHWDRTNRDALIPVSEHVGDWNWGNVQSAGGCCLVVGDELYLYVSGRQGVPGTSEPGICSTGLAKLRRDGFASMELPDPRAAIRRVPAGLPPGTLVTRPVTFSGAHLFVNADMGSEVLRVQIETTDGVPIAPFTTGESAPTTGNGTALPVRWQRAADLASLAGRTVRFRFSMTGGKLYAFWVSREKTGGSGGYLAAGSPGHAATIDA
jgi:hypothetical protein